MSVDATPKPGRAPRRRLGDLSIRTKILAAVLSMAFGAVTVGAVAVSQLGSVHRGADQIYSNNVTAVTTLGQLDAATRQSRISVLLHMVVTDAAAKQQYDEVIKKDDAALDEVLERYKKVSPGARNLTLRFVAQWASYRAIRDLKLLPASRTGDTETMLKVQNSEASPAGQAATATLNELVDAEKRQAADQAAAIGTTYQTGRILILGLLVVGLAVALTLALLLARTIMRSVTAVSRVASALAEGDLTVRAGITSRDELGRMAGELDRASDSLRSTVEQLGENATALATSSEALSATSVQIAAAAEETSAQAEVVSTAAEQVSANVQTVATSSEEMGASIREIAANSAEASTVATSAARLADETSRTMTRLGESSAEIDNVIKLVTSIAEQTNLLALNATIEAARAGESGKGFAVVAGEVKELAQQTARATEDIGRRVEAIQNDTRSAIAAIGEITEVIGQINDRQTTIASAVEEQSVTTSDVSRTVSEASVGTSEIARTISGVASAAQSTSAGVLQAQTAASELSRMSGDLQKIVDGFRC
ncbi:methyl-accepting chemotaxis protein [Micromonospora sp. NPDC049679]|uniref:methyl-accepting chemotaxis protein n=1 Tax=Micromonospora sp. NPDC049679 TaxID=3155920 RepID=UPI0033DB5E53